MATVDRLQVLEEELLALGNRDQPGEAFVAARGALEERRRVLDAAERADRASPTPGTGEARARARAEYEQAYAKVFKLLNDRLHTARRSALCFSGGGIRSATFGLGVLHGLAGYSRAPEPGRRPTLLGELDYLSTVSGGGYLGAWFSGWAAREGVTRVIETLGATPVDTRDPEPAPLRYLRNYTAYLAPRAGLSSVDTWTLVSTVLRNMFLNWLIIVPMVAALVLIPRLVQSVVSLGADPDIADWLPTLARVLLVIGTAAGALASFNMALALPGFGARVWPQGRFIRRILAPVGLSAGALTTYWAWHVLSGVAHRHTLTQFVIYGAAMQGLGASVGAAWVLSRDWSRLRGDHDHAWLASRSSYVILLAMASGGLGGLLGYAGAQALMVEGQLPIRLYSCVAFATVLIIFGTTSMMLAALLSRLTTDEDREWWARSGAWLLLMTLGWLALSIPASYGPLAAAWLFGAASAATATLSTSAVLGALGVFASRFGAASATSSGHHDTAEPQPSSHRRDRMAVVSAVAFFAVLITALAALNHVVVTAVLGSESGGVARVVVDIAWGLALAAVASLFAAFVNINVFSLHAMYRSRLIRAYMGASNPARRANPFTGFDPADNLKMSALGLNGDEGRREKPLHVVNMALNLVKGENLAWQERKAESFTVTALHAGSCFVDYQATASYGGRDGGLDLGTAMAISGAAASPNMGYHSSPIVTLLMTLFNARLGWWLANPGEPGRGAWERESPTWALTRMCDEALGLTTDRNRWIYLSDGGHFENLGLYEMVMRRCHTIVVIDAGADPGYAFDDLGNAVRKIRVDFGIPIELPAGMPIRSRFDPQNCHCAVGSIHYHCIDGDTTADGRPIEDGVLVYIKPVLNGNEPPDVLNYARTSAAFPHEPTTDQFFNEAQFESYRRLGSHTVDEICRDGAGDRGPLTLTLDAFAEKCLAHSRGSRSVPLV